MFFGYVFGGLAVVLSEVDVACAYYAYEVVRVVFEEPFNLLRYEPASWLVIARNDEDVWLCGVGVWGYGECGVG